MTTSTIATDSTTTTDLTIDEKAAIKQAALYFQDNYYPFDDSDESEMQEYKNDLDILFTGLEKFSLAKYFPPNQGVYFLVSD